MSARRITLPLILPVAAALVVGAAGLPAAGHQPASTAATSVPAARDLGAEVLGADDGWASYNGGTTGGVTARAEHTATVSTWAELRAALGGATGARGDTTPRIVYVDGEINAFEDTDGQPLTCEDVASQVTVADTGEPFSMDDYIEHYDPSGTWGWVDPAGPLEEARVAAAALQARQTLQHVGSNVTLVGLGDDARIVGGSIRVRDSHNVIVRNIHFSDAYDCFPAWDPADTQTGNWNSAYDNLSVWTSTNVWVDHNTFDDGDNPPSSLPTVFGRPYEVHDGLLDITHSSDYVTSSYNLFDDHDKTQLIGSSDSRLVDRGTLKVTVHHNHWRDIGQRAPRVRYGDVHVYNNYYEQTSEGVFEYFWGAGIESSIYAENNAFDLADGVDPARVITRWNGTRLFETGSTVNGEEIDLLAAYNAAAPADQQLADEARWTPGPVPVLHDTADVPAVVRAQAGAGRLGAYDGGAWSAPARPALSVTHATPGVTDGRFTLTANLWWGSNATALRFLADGEVVHTVALADASPAAQRASFDVSGVPDGDHRYTVEAVNTFGTTTSRELVVRVRDALPAQAALAHDNGDRDGQYTLTTNLWWGTNATGYRLLEDGVEIDARTLTAATPAAQRVTTSVTDRAPGVYAYQVELSNDAGTTTTRTVTVRVDG
ncbi:hypothetical protein [Oerskovia flava]|uniref:pectate lyase family protein n=1 Tax=Oerskovia flava TaxID=2986422 RepID=UPI00223F0E44|nr:hypothetical protein [Oerskovia sp. JB1-3-2]